MPKRVYKTTSKKEVSIDEDGLEDWGLPFNAPVHTNQGEGTIAGLAANQLYVQLKGVNGVTPFPLDAIGSTVTASAPEQLEKIKTHPLKEVYYKDNIISIVVQAEQGPCPIFAVANCLALQRKIHLVADYGNSIKQRTLNETLSQYFRSSSNRLYSSSLSSVEVCSPSTSGRVASVSKVAPTKAKRKTLGSTLTDKAADCELHRLFCEDPSSPNSIEKTIDRLYDGMDLDVIFSGVEEFVMDRSVYLFALFQLRIYHGWVIGDQMKPYLDLKNMSYNELTTSLAVSSPTSNEAKGSQDGDASSSVVCFTDTMREVAIEFYMGTQALQMTCDGYEALCDAVQEDEISVLFWHNHFFTITRLQGKLVVLLTPESFTNRPTFVFATISYPTFVLDQFLDGIGNPVDECVSFVAASKGEFTDTQILEAQQSLAVQYGTPVPPQMVLDYLVSHESTPTAQLVASPPGQSVSSRDAAVSQVVSVIPSLNHEDAARLLKESNYNVEVTIDKFFCSGPR